MTALSPNYLVNDLRVARPRTDAITRAAMIFIAVAVLTCATIRTVVSAITLGDIEHTSGTWIAMAADARDGILYRPISSPGAIGGTRYAPLHPLLQAALLKAGLGFTSSGLAIELLSMLSILFTSCLIMRRLGAKRLNAVCFSCLILAASGVNATIAANKADLLAAALNLWGLLAITSIPRGGRKYPWAAISAAAIFFALAVATKITCIFGLAAGTIWLFTQSKKQAAALICAIWIALIFAFTAAIIYASDGRAITVFRICAAGGGGIRDLLFGPLMLLANCLQYDLAVGYLWGLAVVVLITLTRPQWLSLPVLLFLISTAGTMAIFGSPGINVNHLVDLYVATLILLAVHWHRLTARAVFSLFIALVLSHQSLWFLRQSDRMLHGRNDSQMSAALIDANASATPGPLLSENPLLPLEAGQRPYLLDSFMFRVTNKSRPDLSQQLWSDLANHKFKAVILTHPPRPNRMYTEWNFGPGFLDRLNEAYELKSTHGDFSVFYPKGD